MLLTNKKDLQLIYPQSQWDKIDTLTNAFDRIERTHLKRYLGSALLRKLNEDVKNYTDGVQTALLSATDDDRWKLDILSACQCYIVHLYFADNVRILATSFNRGGGANKAYSESYDTLDEKELDALSKDLFRRSQDDLEDLLCLLEEDANNDKIYTELWSICTYYYQHTNLLFPTATSLQPYYDIENRREKYQNLVPTISSAQLRHIIPNIGNKLFTVMLELTKGVLVEEVEEGEGDEEVDEVEEVDGGEGDEEVDTSAADRQLILKAALPDLLHSLANYVRADLCTAFKSQQERQQYLLAAKDHINGCCHIICENSDLMADYIMGTPLDVVYSSMFGKTLTQEKKDEEELLQPTEDKPRCCCNRDDDYILDLT